MAIGALLCAAHPASAQFTQQSKLVSIDSIGDATQGKSVALSADGNTAIVGGPGDNFFGAAWVFTRSNGGWAEQAKLVGTGNVGTNPQLGVSVGLSADGNTAIVGGVADNSNFGAAWVFTRSGGVWTQQAKLVGTGAGILPPEQGYSVALSGDGNTAIVGGPKDGPTGAAWVFARSGGVWTQQGSKLVGTGGSGSGSQGQSVALSGDGNTALVGDIAENGSVGATWVFTRSGGVWTQQGSKLVGTGYNGFPEQGFSVALSSDGNTAIVGGRFDVSNIGAVWVFTRSGGVWTQQGPKLVGAGAANGTLGAQQGYSVALSRDGNIATWGAPIDNNNVSGGAVGAVWVFVRSGGVWTQQGSKLVGTGVIGPVPEQGWSVALSADGTTAIWGGPFDHPDIGAAWVFVQPVQSHAATHDFDGNGKSDIAWRDAGGNAAIWLMNGAQVTQAAGVGAAPAAWSIVGQRDFNGDGKYDWLWRDNSGNVAMWFLNGAQVMSSAGVGTIPTVWSVVGTADFNGDGKGDILWQNTTTGDVAIWLMNGAQVTQSAGVGSAPPAVWKIAGTGDFDGDGKSDILWQDTSGNVAIWFMNGAQLKGSAGVGNAAGWSIVGTGDFDGNGKSDILWRNGGNGNVAIWLMNGAQVTQSGGLGSAPASWSIVETGDFDGNGKSDIRWHDSSGNVAIWFMDGVQVAQATGVGTVPTVWSIQGANAD